MKVSTLFARSAPLLANTIQHVAGVRGRYSRGMSFVDNVIGVPGRIDPSGDLIEDVAALDVDSSWIFQSADLFIREAHVTDREDAHIVDRFDNHLSTRYGKATPLVPREGDLWSFLRDDGLREVYIVLPPYSTQYCWEHMDAQGHLTRVYTKYRETIEE